MPRAGKKGRTWRLYRTKMPNVNNKMPSYYVDMSGCDDAEKKLGYRPDCLKCPLEVCLEDKKGKKVGS